MKTRDHRTNSLIKLENGIGLRQFPRIAIAPDKHSFGSEALQSEEESPGPTVPAPPDEVPHVPHNGDDDDATVLEEEPERAVHRRLENAENKLRQVLTLKERELQYVGHGGKRVAFALGPELKKVVKIEDTPESAEEAERKREYQKLCSSYFLEGTVLLEVHRPHHEETPDISFQDYAQRFNDASRVVFCGGYAERKPDLDRELYVKVSRHAICRRGSYDRREFLAVQGNPHLEHFFAVLDRDPAFRKNAEGFLSSLIFFSQDTGEILDCLGRDNVHLYQDQNGEHRYRIIDPIPPGMSALLPEAKHILMKFRAGEHLWGSDLVRAINPVDFVRLVNAVADELGLDPEERILLIDEEVDFERLLTEFQSIATGRGTP